MTELSASPFVLFYLTEYNNIVVMCFLNVILFYGGYLGNIIPTNTLVEGLHGLHILSNSTSIYLLESVINVVNISAKAIVLTYGFI